MGLDMFLTKKTYVKNWEHTEPENRFDVVVLQNGKPHPKIKSDRISYVCELIGEWRKNEILHDWFMDELGEEEFDNITIDHMKSLLDVLTEVENAFNQITPDRRVIHGIDILGNPLEFEDYAYTFNDLDKHLSIENTYLPTRDEFYQSDFEEIEKTIKILRAEIKSNPDDSVSYQYSYSW